MLYRVGNKGACRRYAHPVLLLLWEGHIHVQAIFMVDVFLYIYKYLFKGPDHDQKFA